MSFRSLHSLPPLSLAPTSWGLQTCRTAFGCVVVCCLLAGSRAGGCVGSTPKEIEATDEDLRTDSLGFRCTMAQWLRAEETCARLVYGTLCENHATQSLDANSGVGFQKT